MFWYANVVAGTGSPMMMVTRKLELLCAVYIQVVCRWSRQDPSIFAWHQRNKKDIFVYVRDLVFVQLCEKVTYIAYEEDTVDWSHYESESDGDGSRMLRD